MTANIGYAEGDNLETVRSQSRRRKIQAMSGEILGWIPAKASGARETIPEVWHGEKIAKEPPSQKV